MKMEAGSWFCAAAAALFTVALLHKLRRRLDAGLWLVAPLGTSVCLAVAPALYGAILLGCSLALVWNTMRGLELLPVQNRTVLITGCDSGFGHKLAKLLSEMGAQVFAGVLDLNGAGAQQLREHGSEGLQVLQLDVTDRSQVQMAHQHICAQVGDAGLWALVNNAGILHCPVDVELHPMSVYRRCMEVNFLAAVNMCQVFLPLLRRSRGRVVNVCSLAGDVPIPTYAAYGASKAALSIFSKVMRLELSAWGVRVAVVQPTGFRTNIFGTSDNLNRYRDEILSGISSEAREDYGEPYISSLLGRLSQMPGQVSEDLGPVVDDMCHALLAVRPRAVYGPGALGWLLPFLHRWCPTAAFDAIISKAFKHDCEPAGLRRTP